MSPLTQQTLLVAEKYKYTSVFQIHAFISHPSFDFHHSTFIHYFESLMLTSKSKLGYIFTIFLFFFKKRWKWSQTCRFIPSEIEDITGMYVVLYNDDFFSYVNDDILPEVGRDFCCSNWPLRISWYCVAFWIDSQICGLPKIPKNEFPSS